jgi:hypothetical protein
VIRLENDKMNRYSSVEDDAPFVIWLCGLMNREYELILKAKTLLDAGKSEKECFKILRTSEVTNKQVKYACNAAKKEIWKPLDGFFWPGGKTLKEEYMICNPNQTLTYKSHQGGQKQKLIPNIPTREEFIAKHRSSKLKMVVPQFYQNLNESDWKPNDPNHIPTGQSVYSITRRSGY